MKYEILAPGSFAALEVTLDAEDVIITESGSMAWMDQCIEVKTSTGGGFLAGAKRAILSGDSFFQNEYTTSKAGGKVTLVAGQPGEIRALELTGTPILLERGAYLANTRGVTVNAKFEGLKGFLSEGMFAVQASGTGTLFYSSYGDITEVEVDGTYIVDNGYAVAWESTLNYSITRTGKKLRTFLFGDGLVCRFSGRGKVWTQSRSAYALSNFMYPYREVESKND